MRRLFNLIRIAAVVPILMATSQRANAQTITFNGLGGGNGSAFTSYSEAGFDVDLFSGFVCVAQAFGNPVPDLYMGETCNASVPLGGFRIRRTGGGLFNLLAVDISANNGSAPFSFVGRVSSGVVYVNNGSAVNSPPSSFTFSTYLNPSSSTDVDEVIIDSNPTGTSVNFDNIQLSVRTTGTPEPATLGLLATGFGILGMGYRRRRASH